MGSDDIAGDLVNLPSFGVMEGAGADRFVDRFRAQLAHCHGGVAVCEQPARADQRGFVARADGDDTADEHLEWGVKTLLRELEQRRLREWGDRLADTGHRDIDIERAFHRNSRSM